MAISEFIVSNLFVWKQ